MQEGVLGRVMESGKIYVNTGRCVGTSVEVRLYHRFFSRSTAGIVVGPGVRFGCYSLDEIRLNGMLSCRPDHGSFVPVLMESHTLEMANTSCCL